MSSRLLLDRAGGALRHARLGRFDADARVWRPDAAAGAPIGLRDAVR
jgi:hypothetical protein